MMMITIIKMDTMVITMFSTSIMMIAMVNVD